MDTVEYQLVLGRRIAQERRRQGLSQPELAALLDRPVGWVSQLERGIQPIEGPTVLRTVAAALELPLADLTSGGHPAAAPARPADPRGARNGRAGAAGGQASRTGGQAGRAAGAQGEAAAAEGLRLILAGAHSLCAMLGDRPAPSAAWLRARTDQACTLAGAGQHADLADVLADLLPALEAAVRSGRPADQADRYELMAMAYQACAAALARLGEAEAAWVAADRAMAAAERAGNLVLVAAGAHRLASVFLSAQRYALAEETARTTIAALGGLAGLGDPDAVALCGAVSLLRAAVAARAGRQGTAYGHLARARHLAARLGGQRASGAPEFGPETVAVYEIAVCVDLGDAGHALRVAAATDLTGLSPGRRARVLIDVARAHTLREQADQAAEALAAAAAIGPGYVTGSERAREVMASLLALRRPPPTALADLRARLGDSAAR